MRERVGAVEGQLRILSAPGEGTQVEACIPLPEPKLKETEENERKFDTADVG
jgi:hypothetical protein